MNGAESLLRTLLANDVDLCLMNPGTSEMQFVSALDRVPGMRGVLGLFEGVCSGAADGYARMAGKPAATLLHLGPGLGNALANFHNARKAFSPIVNIVGEHSTQHLGHDAPLTADIEAFAHPVSGWVRTLKQADAMGEAASAAVAAALGPPGKVATLIVPADFSWTEVAEAANPGPRATRPTPQLPSASQLRAAADALRFGRPVALLLGGSALHTRGLRAAARIRAATGVKIFANRNSGRMSRGAGVPAAERIPYFPEAAQSLLAGFERIILLEAKPPVSFFGYPGLRSTLAPPECAFDILAGLDQDGAAALESLADELNAPTSFDIPTPERPTLPIGEPLTAAAIGRAVAALVPEAAIFSDESISSNEQIWPHLAAAPAHDHLPVTGGSIGQGLPVALGAALACPGRKVVALEADGSAMYTVQSLWTMARENLDVTIVILANRRYRILDVEMRRTRSGAVGPRADQMLDLSNPAPDWIKLSEGFGVEAARAATADDFIREFSAAMRTRGPRLIEAQIP
jgi:acetolactate synthase-1/2/3 large subunit